jgi:subtilisin family serine protease
MSGTLARRLGVHAVKWLWARVGAVGALVVGVGALAGDPAGAVPKVQAPVPKYHSVLTQADIDRLSKDATERSIVIMRDQHLDVAGVPATRAARVNADQQPVWSELTRLRSRGMRRLQLVNAVAATISPAEKQRLQSSPAIRAVVPDLPVPQRVRRDQGAATRSAPVTGPAQQICPTDPTKPLLEPEALQLMNVEFDPGSGKPAAHDIVDGTGVKVAWLADGIDINNPEFQRDGHTIFTDYQDFTTEGTNAPTDGAEAFGDASGIAAQGNLTYDLNAFVHPSHPLPAGCTIRIKGVAPGATLVGLKVFGNDAIPFTSYFLQAIDRAVNVDKVDVINQSFGANVYPDPANDPIALADTAAAAAGVTVVASSGDAGTTNTIGTPSDAAGVIGVGGTTSFRLYRQTTSFGTQLVPGGFVSNNISSLSSGGFTQFGPHTVDVVAPGDLGWAACTADPALYAGCLNNAGAPANFQAFGGTSQSSPLTAGTAALVIQAYMKTHHGAKPGAALVKRIIVSSATDLHVPAEEQGAGLVNALKAVRLAESIPGNGRTVPPQGSTLLADKTRLSATAPAGSTQAFTVNITNTGANTQTVKPVGSTLSPTLLLNDTGTLSETPATDPTFVDGGGVTSSYVTHTFTVPAGAQRLDASVTWDGAGQPASRVRETLFDPLGRVAAYTLPQGPGGFNHVDVHDPTPGKWTAVFWTRDNATVYTGQFKFSFTAQKFQTVGTVTPAFRTLAPGATGSFQVKVKLPTQPGDLGVRLTLGTGNASDTSIPITVRSLVGLGTNGGSFTGTLTGGNGRPIFGAQTLTFQFDVPAGKRSLNLGIALRDPGYNLTGLLVDPGAEPLNTQSTTAITSAAFTRTMQFFQRTPRAGRWMAILTLNAPVNGQNLTEPFTGNISFGSVPVSAPALPNSASRVLTAGTPVAVPVRITNTGNSDKAFFVDPRLNQRGPLELLGLNPTHVSLPIHFGEPQPAFLVPTNSTQLVSVANASGPVQIDMNPQLGSPDVEGVSFTNASVAIHNAAEVSPGVWFVGPTGVGPFGAGPPPAETADVAAAVTANLFDPAVTSDSGDLWALSVFGNGPFNPIVLSPGQTGFITATITPSAPKGSVVSGFLGVDSFNPNTTSGDEVVNLPYTYKVG